LEKKPRRSEEDWGDAKNQVTLVLDPRKNGDFANQSDLYGSGSKPCTPVVHIKIAGKWMFIPLKIVLIGIDP